MRLLNVDTFKLEDFYDQDIPRYAILSHTWTKDEVTFQEFPTLARNDPRLAKADGCCSRAGRDRIPYVWIDTFCIDKSSSAELSEAINSMYRWYRQSEICYVYLTDVHDDSTSPGSSFWTSRWFTRGWTLQELVAPFIVEFFDSSWRSIGLKCENRVIPALGDGFRRKLGGMNGDLSETIMQITGIASSILRRSEPMQSTSVAERMGWASRRKTTRSEDMAYSLFGIFGINMPLLYGEGGQRAFFRLQEEIIRQTHDHTIFSWGYGLGPTHEGVLARSPQSFAHCGNIVSRLLGKGGRSHYTVTNLGVQIQVPVVYGDAGTHYALFNAARRGAAGKELMAIPLSRGADADEKDDDILTRAAGSIPLFLPETWLDNATKQQLYLSNLVAKVSFSKNVCTIHLPPELIQAGYRPAEIYPPHALMDGAEEGPIRMGSVPGTAINDSWALLKFESPTHPPFQLSAVYRKHRCTCTMRQVTEADVLLATLKYSAGSEGAISDGPSWREQAELDRIGVLSVSVKYLENGDTTCRLRVRATRSERRRSAPGLA
ncbi:HET-domain-containing protein [Pleurostoma richardsiae]|uniref:HET-domain-containing protein n=1 Tax=Pleurostoma richardsiae TaxID=41990 RepID=A0AA38VGA6_9PEZI|nr:HET-domain-containing protein [Pleurostoma richardsiae]